MNMKFEFRMYLYLFVLKDFVSCVINYRHSWGLSVFGFTLQQSGDIYRMRNVYLIFLPYLCLIRT